MHAADDVEDFAVAAQHDGVDLGVDEEFADGVDGEGGAVDGGADAATWPARSF